MRSSSTEVVALRTIVSATKSTPDRLHARLAHVSVETTKSSAKHKVTTGLDITLSIGADPPCVSCVRGKLAQHTFPDKGSDAEEALAVVHIDLCGPFRVIAKDGSLFFLLLKDRHTRFVWVMPVAKKSDVLREFQKWLVLVERQAKKLVLMLRSDRGGEFLGKEFSDFVDGKGIVHDLACPYTPQQNGMAEREMRIVVKSVRTMLLHMDVQHHWWHLALRQADWVRNCLERSTTPPETSPYQLLTGKKPDLTLARVWGCMVQFMVLEQQRGGKLAPKARWGVHLGVLPDSKGWEVLDLVKIPTTRPLGSSGIPTTRPLGLKDQSGIASGLLTDLTDNKVVTSVEVIFYKTLSLEVWKVKFGPASGRTQAHLPMDTSTATVPLLAEIDEPADQDVVEVLPPPPVLAPPFPVADQPASTPMSATSDEGSLKASPVAPASGIAGGQQGVKLIDQDGKPSTTEEQQTGEPVEQEATAGLQSTGELPKSAGGGAAGRERRRAGAGWSPTPSPHPPPPPPPNTAAGAAEGGREERWRDGYWLVSHPPPQCHSSGSPTPSHPPPQRQLQQWERKEEEGKGSTPPITPTPATPIPSPPRLQGDKGGGGGWGESRRAATEGRRG
ncbi:unnamed protein product [Closterium sp. NIES-53]